MPWPPAPWWVSSKAHRLQRKATAKRRQHEAKVALPLPPLDPLVTQSLEEDIALGSSAAQLVQRIHAGTLSSYAVASVLCKRARLLGGGLNALTEELFDEALAEARQKDRDRPDRRQAPSSPLGSGLLEGMPVSIKDHVDVKGVDSTTGQAAKCFAPRPKDALVVELLRDAGAIVFCKTANPQCLMIPETTNNIWGTTTNPWDAARGPGGSSGGEGALVAARATKIGIGTDIGGSCRVPAHFCGCVGFKPTPWRVSQQGITLPFKEGKPSGMQAIKLTAGPVANHVEDCALVCQAWWVPKMWQRDPYVVPLPFDMATYAHGPQRPEKKKVRLGWFTTDDWIEPSRAGKRAVHLAKEALEKTGKYEFVALKLDKATNGWEAVRLFYKIVSADGGLHAYKEGLEGEPMLPAYRKVNMVASMPDGLRPLVNLLLHLLGEKRLHVVAKDLKRGGFSARAYWELCKGLEAYQQAWLRMLQGQEVDGLLCPGPALPALPHGMSQQLESSCSYTFFLNLLHWPAGSVPVTTVQPSEAVYPRSDLPRVQQDSIAKAAARAMRGSAGLPVGVQVATMPFADELCLRIMKDLEAAVGFQALSQVAQRLVFP